MMVVDATDDKCDYWKVIMFFNSILNAEENNNVYVFEAFPKNQTISLKIAYGNDNYCGWIWFY